MCEIRPSYFSEVAIFPRYEVCDSGHVDNLIGMLGARQNGQKSLQLFVRILILSFRVDFANVWQIENVKKKRSLKVEKDATWLFKRREEQTLFCV